MPLTIIFNGTSDTYHPTDMSYLIANKLTGIKEGSHTLSFFADCIARSADQKHEPLLSKVNDPGLIKVDNDVVILNGPDDLGTGVHNLIVSGFMAALNAVMRGEQDINFVGFSRGSVEATHMTHEVQRIIDYLNDPTKDHSCEGLAKFICDGCYNPGTNRLAAWRTNRINTYYRAALETCLKNPVTLETFKNGLRSSTTKFRLNGMLLDPVPGLMEGSSLFYIPWKSPHHNVIAPIVEELSVTYMNDEFSTGFRAVWIERSPESHTKIITSHLPGYHGTANGNPVNHTPEASIAQGFPYQNLRDVQKLYFYKLLQFAYKHGVQLQSADHVAGRFLTPIYEQFLRDKDNIAAQNATIRELHAQIATNLSNYRRTRETCYIPSILGIAGGAEHIHQERILMTKSGERSLAECFNFNTKDAHTYVNFDHFVLDFMNLLFPELASPSPDSPNKQALSYSGMQEIVRIRHASPAPEGDNTALLNKIRGLLNACQSHNLDEDLNKILLNDSLDHAGVLTNLLDLIPAKLAGTFFNHPTSELEPQLVELIHAIIRFDLRPLRVEENSEQHAMLLQKKQTYLQKFKDHMLREMVEQTQNMAVSLLEGQAQVHKTAMRCEPTSTGADSAFSGEEIKEVEPSPTSTFDVWDYLSQAQEYYRSLQDFKIKLDISGVYLKPKDLQNLQYEIEDAIAMLPVKCEMVMEKHGQLWQPAMRNFPVTQLWRQKLDTQEELDQVKRSHMALHRRKQASDNQLALLQAKKRIVVEEFATQQKSLAEQLSLSAQLQAHLQTIQNILLSSRQVDYFGNFTLQILYTLGTLLGTILATVSTSTLILGTASIALPMLGLVTGVGLTALSLFHLRKTNHRERDETLAANFFPTTKPI